MGSEVTQLVATDSGQPITVPRTSCLFYDVRARLLPFCANLSELHLRFSTSFFNMILLLMFFNFFFIFIRNIFIRCYLETVVSSTSISTNKIPIVVVVVVIIFIPFSFCLFQKNFYQMHRQEN